MKSKALIIMPVVILAMAACKKNEPEDPLPGPSPSAKVCQLALQKNSSGMITDSFGYDAQGRVTKVQDYDHGTLDSNDYFTLQYSSTAVIMYNQDGDEKERGLIGSNGYFSTLYIRFPEVDTVQFTYDAAGQLIHESHSGRTAMGNLSIYTVSYTLSSGDVLNKKVIHSQPNADTITYTYTYYTDLARNGIGTGGNRFYGYQELTGKRSVHNIKSMTSSSGGAEQYSYSRNAEGYVTSMSVTKVLGGTTQYLYEYSCK